MDNDEIKGYRLKITDLVEDLKGSEDNFESMFIVNKLSFLLSEFIMRVNRRWIGEGKWIYKELNNFDKEFALKFDNAFSSFYSQKDKKQLIEFIEDSLYDVGGFFIFWI